MPETNRKLRVFLCHASQDKPVVRELYQRLLAEKWIDPWLDEEKLLPGQDWDMEIEKAVETSDAVIVCLSNTSVSKEGYIQRELKFALDIALEKPEDAIFIIPLRLDDCELPRRLRSWQYLDYFSFEQPETAYRRLLLSLQVRVQQPSVVGDKDTIATTTNLESVKETDTEKLTERNSDIQFILQGDEDMKIQSGYISAGNDDPKWQLLNGQGERPFKKRIDFKTPFDEPPTVTVSLSGIDSDKSHNLRIKVEAKDVDRNGFYISLLTWSATRVYRVWVQWVAYGGK